MNKIFLRIALFLIGLILFIDSAVLLSLKKLHLGTVLPLLIGLVFIGCSFFYQRVKGHLFIKPNLRKFWRVGWALFAVWCLSLSLFFIYIYKNSQDDTYISDVAAIIVLGSGIKNNQPSPALAERLNTAAEIFAKNNHALIVVTGGLGFAQTLTEAQVMSTYLQEKHQIPADKIALEDKSTSTELNLKNSQPILARYSLNNSSATVIVTNDFHTLRAEAIARKLGFENVTTAGAKTPLLIRYNAWLREYFAYISGWLLNEY